MDKRMTALLSGVDWNNAVSSRHSVRHYAIKNVEDDKMAALHRFSEYYPSPFDHGTEVRFFKATPDKDIYGNLLAPPDNMAFIADTDIKSITEAGFVGELMILYATSLGLSTCWFGHYILEALERRLPHLGIYAETVIPKKGYGKGKVDGARAIGISPIGYPAPENGLMGIADKNMERNGKRKTIQELLEDSPYETDLSETVRYALEMTRIAPSACNAQPWRFKVAKDSKVVQLYLPIGYRHFRWEHPNIDIGVAACHFWLALYQKGIDSHVTIEENHDRAVWTFEWI